MADYETGVEYATAPGSDGSAVDSTARSAAAAAQSTANALAAESGFKWVHASSAARIAQAVVTADRGKLSFQTDIERVYRLTSVSPVKWTQLQPDDIGEWRDILFLGGAASGTPTANGAGTGNNTNVTTTLRSATGGTTKGAASVRTGFVLTVFTAGQEGNFRPSPPAGGRLPGADKVGSRHLLRWTRGATSTNKRWQVGFSAVTAGALTGWTHCLVVGRETGDTNRQIRYNDGAGAPTVIDLGASFPGEPATDALQELEIYVAEGGARIGYCYRDLDLGLEVSGSLTSNLPDTLSAIHVLWMGNGVDAVAVGLDAIAVKWAPVNR